MTRAQATYRFFSSPFVALWGVLTKIAALSRPQVRSLVTVGFLLGMTSLSVENWFTTWYLRDILESTLIATEKQKLFFDFLTERMRYTSLLQGLVAIALTAVILNADRLSVKGAGVEATLGSDV